MINIEQLLSGYVSAPADKPDAAGGAASPDDQTKGKRKKGKKRPGMNENKAIRSAATITEGAQQDEGRKTNAIKILDGILQRTTIKKAGTLDALAASVIAFRNKGVFIPVAKGTEIQVKLSQVYDKFPTVRAAIEQRYTPATFELIRAGQAQFPTTPEGDADFARFLDSITDKILGDEGEQSRIGRNDVNSLVIGMMTGRIPHKPQAQTLQAVLRYINTPQVKHLMSRLFALKGKVQGDPDLIKFAEGIARGANPDSAEASLARVATTGEAPKAQTKIAFDLFALPQQTTVPRELAPYNPVYEKMLQSPQWHEHMREGFVTVLQGLYAQLPPQEGSSIQHPKMDSDAMTALVRMFLSKAHGKAQHAIRDIATNKDKAESQRNRELRMYANALWAFASYGLCTVAEQGGKYVFSVKPDALQHMTAHVARAMGTDNGAPTNQYFDAWKAHGIKSPDSVIKLVANRLNILGKKVPTTPEQIAKLYEKSKKDPGKPRPEKPARQKPEGKSPEAATRLSKMERSVLSFIKPLISDALRARQIKTDVAANKDVKNAADRLKKLTPNPQTIKSIRETEKKLRDEKAAADRWIAEKAAFEARKVEDPGARTKLAPVSPSNPFFDQTTRQAAENLLSVFSNICIYIGTAEAPKETGFEALTNIQDAATGQFLEGNIPFITFYDQRYNPQQYGPDGAPKKKEKKKK
ncbi:MAG: hypothetical protein RI911_58 [Candidatus Parcubacteria bacterium]|jgi:hypothetical protein